MSDFGWKFRSRVIYPRFAVLIRNIPYCLRCYSCRCLSSLKNLISKFHWRTEFNQVILNPGILFFHFFYFSVSRPQLESISDEYKTHRAQLPDDVIAAYDQCSFTYFTGAKIDDVIGGHTQVKTDASKTEQKKHHQTRHRKHSKTSDNAEDVKPEVVLDDVIDTKDHDVIDEEIMRAVDVIVQAVRSRRPRKRYVSTVRLWYEMFAMSIAPIKLQDWYSKKYKALYSSKFIVHDKKLNKHGK